MNTDRQDFSLESLRVATKRRSR